MRKRFTDENKRLRASVRALRRLASETSEISYKSALHDAIRILDDTINDNAVYESIEALNDV